MDAQKLAIKSRMYQYSRAIYRSIKDLIDPHATREEQLESRRAVLAACEDTMERLARDPLYFAKPERALITEQIEAGAFDGGVPRCRATTRKGKPCQRTPLPEREYCPSHQHLADAAA